MNEIEKLEQEVETLAEKVDRFFETKFVHTIILGLILITSICAGISTFPEIEEAYKVPLSLVETAIISVFVIELTARIIVTGKKFFKNYWNVFDLIVVTASLIPISGGFTILRVLRILHCINLLDILPKTKHVVDGFLRSLPSIINVIFLEFVFIYTFAIMAYHLYGKVAPEQFGHVGLAMYNLFSILGTLDWAILAGDIQDVAPRGWIFMLIYTFIVGYVLLNFVVGAVIDAMSDAGNKDAKNKGTHDIENKFNHLMKEIENLRQAIEKQSKK